MVVERKKVFFIFLSIQHDMLITIFCKESEISLYLPQFQNYTLMKKSLLFALICIVLMSVASCNHEKHSKAFNECKEIIDKATELSNKATNCEDLDMATFRLRGIYNIEGIDSISEDERALFSEQLDKLLQLVEAKMAEFNCVDLPEESEISDDLPSDAPYDEEIE